MELFLGSLFILYSSCLYHSLTSPPNWGGHRKKLKAKRVFFKKMGGKFGGDIPPNWGGNSTFSAPNFLGVSPPNDLFWGGSEGLQVWRGNLPKFSLSPPKKCSLEGTFVGISPANLEGTAHFFGVPLNVEGGVPPPLLRWWGGTLCPPQTWGGHLGGTDFALGGGDFTSPSPPQ